MSLRRRAFSFSRLVKAGARSAAAAALFFLAVLPQAMANDQLFTPSDVPHWDLDPLTYERGFVMGNIVSAEYEGLPGIRTVEGVFQLGVDSSDAIETNEQCVKDKTDDVQATTNSALTDAQSQAIIRSCSVTVNPWPFSAFNYSYLTRLDELKSGPVLMYYKAFRAVLITRTHHLIQQAWPITPTRKLSRASLSAADLFVLGRFLHYAKGSVEGRVVQASLVGNIRENYRVRIQIGPSGNNFMDMNVSTTELFDFIVETMAAGRYVRLSFLQLYGFESEPSALLTGAETDYRIFRVDVLSQH